MKSRSNVLSMAACLAASIFVVYSASAQPWAAIAAGGISNPNAPGGNVGINVGPPGLPSTACDPLEVGSSGLPAALRLSGIGPAGPCGGICNYAQLGFDPGGIFLPIGVPNSLAIGTQGCANDVVIGTNGAAGGFIRLATGGVGFLTERVTVDNAGNVGINNVAPAQALDVTGTINVTADILLGNMLQANGSFGNPNDVLTINAGGIPTWTSGSPWIYGGNGVGSLQTLGTTTNFSLPFITNNVTRMTIAAAGNVGIGTTTPSEALDVAGNVRFSSALMPNNLAGTAGQVLQSNGAGTAPTWVAAPAPANTWSWGGNAVPALPGAATTLGTTTNQDLPLITNTFPRVTITTGPTAATGGNVGIGTTTPAQRLDVVGNVQFSGDLRPGGLAGNPGELLQASGISGTPPSWASIASVVTSTAVTAHAWGLSGNNPASGSFLGTVSSATNPDVVFKVNGDETVRMKPNGTSGNPGYVGIGTTTPGTYRLYVSGNTYMNGDLTATGTVTFTSDARFKQNVATVDNALSKVMQLRGVTYQFRQTEFPDKNFASKGQIGLIAQEVEQIVPEVVATAEDGYKGIAYQNLVALLVESTKEQQGIIEGQRATIDDLSVRLARLEALIDPSAKPVTPQTKDEAGGIQLEQNTPNPFDRSTTIRYMVPATIGSAEMVIFEAATGREVERFIIANRGEGEVTVSVAGFASGNYVYGIVADGKLAQTRTMVVAR